MLVQYIETNTISIFFDFLNEYVFIYRTCIKEDIVYFVKALVQRVLVELQKLDGSEQKSNYIINQSWNVLRSICETSEYIPAYLDRIEEEMKPILEFAATPEKIDFDDDISLLLATSIKLSKRLTETQKAIFKCFEPMHSKYKGIFGNLLTCLNMFIVYNDGWFSENPDAVKDLNTMATKSLFYNEQKGVQISTNCDGCLIFQLSLQYLKSPTFDDYFESCLENTTLRIKQNCNSEVLKVSLLGNYLSAFIYSPAATFKYLENAELLMPVFEELFTLD